MAKNEKFRILVVDDDKAMRLSLVELLEASGWEVQALAGARKVAEELPAFWPDAILSDVRMPGMSGLELLASLPPDGAPPLVLISAHGDIPTAVSAMQQGAYSFIEKPYDPRRLLTALRHAAEQHRLALRNSRLRERLAQLSGLDRVLLGQSELVISLRDDILDIAPIDASVLIVGETGTGKDLVARALHDLSGRADSPFVALNCAVLSPESFEEEMFGHAEVRDGRLRAASGGTLFLDEIALAPPDVQAKLLRVIEEQQILPVGSIDPVPIDLRIITATNEDPETAVADGRLRRDLLFRINTMMLNLPPLRQRREDILLLAAHFLSSFADIFETEVPEISHDDTAALLAHDWPGNVRELRNACERRILSARRGLGSMKAAIMGEQAMEEVPPTLREAVAAFERELIGKAIKAHEGRMDAAAEALGIGRRTLNEKIVKLGLDKSALL